MAGRTLRALLAAAIGLSAAVAAADEFDPAGLKKYFTAKPAVRKPKVTISKETTFVTGPLKPDGTVDFIAALNEMLSKGVTPENNAMVPLVRVLGPNAIEQSIRAEYFKRLGMEELPEEGEYLVRSYEIIAKHLPPFDQRDAAAQAKENRLYDEMDIVALRPWKRDEFPVFHEWIKANQEPVALLREAATRTRYYSPIILKKDASFLDMLSGLSIAGEREGCRLLTARAMRALGEGKINDAWQDLLAVRRLGRLHSQGGFAVHWLVGEAYGHLAIQPTAILLHLAKPTPERMAPYCKDIAQLPHRPTLADLWNGGERVFCVGHIWDIATGKHELLPPLNELFAPSTDEQKAANYRLSVRLLAHPDVDWTDVLAKVNQSYDELAAALKQPTAKQRREALAKRSAQIDEAIKALGDFATLEKRINESPDKRPLLTQYLVHEAFLHEDDALGGTRTMAATGDVRDALWDTMFALAAYRAEHGTYPERLGDLTPKFLPTAPIDAHSDDPLVYKADGKGYLLYSVGVNRLDNGGKNVGVAESFDSTEETDPKKVPDDIGVRVGVE